MTQAKDVKISDTLLAYNIDLMRMSNGVVRNVIAELKALEVAIVKLLDQGTITEWRKARLNKTLSDINKTTKRFYERIEEIALDGTQGVALTSAEVVATSITEAFQGALTATLPSDAVLEKLATNAMIQGAPQVAWWGKQSPDSVFRFQNAVRRGVTAGLANQHIIKSVRDELGVSQRHAETLVRTSILTVSNESLMDSYKANADVLKGVEWVATLDSRTCMQCAPRDGLTWTLDGKGIGHRVSFRTPPIHFSCRCIMSAITRTFKEMGIDLPELKPIDRSSVAGPVGGNMDFEAFLKRQGKEFQKEVLGEKRVELWRDGKITLLDLINGQGRVLTLDEIKNRRR